MEKQTVSVTSEAIVETIKTSDEPKLRMYYHVVCEPNDRGRDPIAIVNGYRVFCKGAEVGKLEIVQIEKRAGFNSFVAMALHAKPKQELQFVVAPPQPVAAPISVPPKQAIAPANKPQQVQPANVVQIRFWAPASDSHLDQGAVPLYQQPQPRPQQVKVQLTECVWVKGKYTPEQLREKAFENHVRKLQHQAEMRKLRNQYGRTWGWQNAAILLQPGESVFDPIFGKLDDDTWAASRQFRQEDHTEVRLRSKKHRPEPEIVEILQEDDFGWLDDPVFPEDYAPIDPLTEAGYELFGRKPNEKPTDFYDPIDDMPVEFPANSVQKERQEEVDLTDSYLPAPGGFPTTNRSPKADPVAGMSPAGKRLFMFGILGSLFLS